MVYFIQFITILIFSVVLLMPFWIRAISRAPVSTRSRRWIMMGMVSVSIVFTAYALFRPHPSHLPTQIIGTILCILYLLVVLGTCFMSWPRSLPKQRQNR